MSLDCYREPGAVITMMAELVRPTDGCSHCGYQFGDLNEGCDACDTITDILEDAGKAFEGET